MLKFHGRYLGVLAFVALAGVLLQPVQAGPPRLRTLKYDPDRKEWVEVPPPAPGTPDGDLYAIRVEIKEGRYRRALSGVKRFLRQYGESDPAYPGVLIAKAEALIGQQSYFKAHEVLQEFFGQFAGTELTSEALRLEFVIAEAYLGGTKRKIAGLRLLSGMDVAYTILDDISTGYPREELAELAIKAKADHLFANGEHALAQWEYTRLLQEHPSTRYHQFALRRAAEAALASFAGVPYDETPLIEAEDRYREYLQHYQASGDREEVELILDTIRERRAEKERRVAAYYERTDHLTSAVFYYQLIREQWPGTAAATQATRRLELLGALDRQASADRAQPGGGAL